ncbi:TPA: hypothetical protein U5D93_003491 [Yersinia enterocolitica]|uniref:hypothetical protein n=1 Tax=Yersinia proxima TaxID=2890316 RepID=UPI0009817CF9|nr:hypothetical protein [Yersinia proxima]HDL8239492.1 hypothetical protein [Yersinia enterocolitica]HDL8420922.1 hypothetical protein [Yersinia enterocolitica]HEN3302909.1 hypothetical protein [Yersinia enterocolitica]HEN3393369.1 hypothetical protein [Yersinia enterocolitica]
MSDFKPIVGERVILKNDNSPKAGVFQKNISTGYMGESGNITKHIGTGDNAKDSFVWMTLRYCFLIAGLTSFGVFIAYLYFVFFKDDARQIDLMSNLKDVWSIFTPIITLALGYAFGKRENNK